MLVWSLTGRLKLGPFNGNVVIVGVIISGVNTILKANSSAICVTIHSVSLTWIFEGKASYRLINISNVSLLIAILLATDKFLLPKFK